MDALTRLPAVTTLASFCAFQLLFHFLSAWFSARVSPAFRRLSSDKKIEWNSRVVSTCHSLVVGTLGLYIFFFDEATIADPLWGTSRLMQVNVAIASGYLISDLLTLLWYWKVIGDKYFIIHHCASLYSFFFVLKNGVLGYVANFRLLSELSSPFVNQRWFLEALQYPKLSRANVANGVLLTLVFFLVRIAVLPTLYGFLFSVLGTEPYARLGLQMQCIWIGNTAVLDVLNVLWMVRIARGCLKVLALLQQEKASGRHLQNGKLD